MKFKTFLANLRALRNDDRGSIAFIAALLALPLVGATGFAVDYTRITSFRTKVDNIAGEATLAGLHSARIALKTNPTISNEALTKIFQDRAREVFEARAPGKVDLIFINQLVFNRVGDTATGQLDYGALVTTYFGGLVNIPTVPINGSTVSVTPILPDPPASDPSIVFEETFAKSVTPYNEIAKWGFAYNYNNWLTPNGAFEVGEYDQYQTDAPPTGQTNIAELNGQGNASMSRKLFLNRGTYELRYWIRDRITNSNYDPAWICGSKTEDVNWAGEGSAEWGYQTNRVGVYLDRAPNDEPPKDLTPETHGLIDVCAATGAKWIERSVKITTDASGYFWLTFQAEGTNDGAGGLLSTIKVCRDACKETQHHNFPWARNTTLYKEGFETPVSAQAATLWYETTLDKSGENLGWPKLAPGWTTWPANQIEFQSWTAKEGKYSIELDATVSATGEVTAGQAVDVNRAISRRFILAPGYYNVSYYYMSRDTQAPTVMCGLDSFDADMARLWRNQSWRQYAPDSMMVRVYMDSDRTFSHPVSEPKYLAVATWANPYGVKGALLPKLPATPIDVCIVSKNYVKRSADVKITKPGFYWLTMRAEGVAEGMGAIVDDFIFSALGPLSDAAPKNVVTIPAPGVAVGTILRARGYEFVAN